MGVQAASLDAVLEAALERVLDRRLRPLEEAIRQLQPTEEVLSVEGAAALLGWRPRTVRLKAKAGGLPAFKPPGSSGWRFRRGELLAWMQKAAAVDTEEESRKIVASLRRR